MIFLAEIRQRLEEKIEGLVATGMSRKEAAARAIVRGSGDRC